MEVMNKATEFNIRKSIEASKERCKLRNLDTELKYSHKIIEGAALQEVLKRNRDLIELSKPFIEHLYNFVKGSNFYYFNR